LTKGAGIFSAPFFVFFALSVKSFIFCAKDFRITADCGSSNPLSGSEAFNLHRRFPR
jgi:hypothetical protein